VSAKEKLIRRFLTLPKDFTFEELVKLLTALGFSMSRKGKTSGSRVKFTHAKQSSTIQIHKPHTSGEPVKEAALKEIYAQLTEKRYIEVEQKNSKMDYLHYKGYTGSIGYEADGSLAGKVLGMTHDLILYEGSTLDELRADFAAGIESYFESCEEMGIAPRKPVPSLSVSIPPEVHEQIVFLAEQKGVSIDDIVEEALLQVAATAKNATATSGKKNKIACKLPAKTSRKLAVS
jgi:predicted HicB family RNase H-like nuclease/predicted RNA binding protein YcfA (HicA-like mRNA interferase family)